MKKVIFLSFLVLGGFITSFAQGYYPNRNVQAPVDQYYYYPDENLYYYPYTNNYIYYDQNRWCSNSYLPDYFRFNASSFRVSINYHGNSIWSQNNNHVRQYRDRNNGYYYDNHGRNNGYTFKGQQRGDRHYRENSHNRRYREDHHGMNRNERY